MRELRTRKIFAPPRQFRPGSLAVMGPCKNKMTCRRKVDTNDAVIIPAGTWHNLINTGNIPLKIYSIYAPPHHPFGTVQRTKKEAQQAE